MYRDALVVGPDGSPGPLIEKGSEAERDGLMDWVVGGGDSGRHSLRVQGDHKPEIARESIGGSALALYSSESKCQPIQGQATRDIEPWQAV